MQTLRIRSLSSVSNEVKRQTETFFNEFSGSIVKAEAFSRQTVQDLNVHDNDVRDIKGKRVKLDSDFNQAERESKELAVACKAKICALNGKKKDEVRLRRK